MFVRKKKVKQFGCYGSMNIHYVVKSKNRPKYTISQWKNKHNKWTFKLQTLGGETFLVKKKNLWWNFRDCFFSPFVEDYWLAIGKNSKTLKWAILFFAPETRIIVEKTEKQESTRRRRCLWNYVQWKKNTNHLFFFFFLYLRA